MIINKITTGFVIQTFDTDRRQYTHQEFVAGDQVDYENKNGNSIIPHGLVNADGSEPYLPFDMVQPKEI